jgi:hypothetical protein
MAATGIKCTLYINIGDETITESHVHTSTDFTAVKPAFIKLFTARMAMCGPGCTAAKGRMSLIGSSRQVTKLSADDLAIMPPMTQQQLANTFGAPNNATSDIGKVDIIAEVAGGLGFLKRVFVAGIPEPAVGVLPNGPRVNLHPTWAPLWNAWVRQMTLGVWSYIGRDAAPGNLFKTNVLNWTTDLLDGFTGAEISTNLTKFTPGTQVMIRGVNMNNPAYQSPRGVHIVDSVSENDPVTGHNIVYLRTTQGVPIAQVKDLGTMELVLFVNRIYTTVTPSGQGTHKRGNRSVVGPGRRTIRRKISL